MEGGRAQGFILPYCACSSSSIFGQYESVGCVLLIDSRSEVELMVRVGYSAYVSTGGKHHHHRGVSWAPALPRVPAYALRSSMVGDERRRGLPFGATRESLRTRLERTIGGGHCSASVGLGRRGRSGPEIQRLLPSPVRTLFYKGSRISLSSRGIRR